MDCANLIHRLRLPLPLSAHTIVMRSKHFSALDSVPYLLSKCYIEGKPALEGRWTHSMHREVNIDTNTSEWILRMERQEPGLMERLVAQASRTHRA